MRGVRERLDRLAAIGGKVGSVRDLLEQQRSELDQLRAQAQELQRSAASPAAVPAAGDDALSGAEADADPILQAALKLSETVQQRTIADAKRNIEALEAISAGLKTEHLDIDTFRYSPPAPTTAACNIYLIWL
jgi:hypothetical protein